MTREPSPSNTSPLAIVQAWMQAGHQGDRERARALLASDFVLHAECAGPLGGDHVGADGVFGFFDSLSKRRVGGRALDLLGGDRFVAEVYERDGTVNGATESTRIVVLYEVADGRIVKMTFLPLDHAQFEQML